MGVRIIICVTAARDRVAAMWLGEKVDAHSLSVAS